MNCGKPFLNVFFCYSAGGDEARLRQRGNHQAAGSHSVDPCAKRLRAAEEEAVR